MIDQATSFVMSRIDNWIGTRGEGDTAAVPTEYELPYEAVKEAIVNAVCHRDYTSNGSVQVMLFRNRLEVWNPGQLPYGLTVQKLFEPHKSLPANPLLADPMFWIGYIEKVGTGTEDIVKWCKDKGLQDPEYHQEEDFRVVLWRKKPEDDPEVIQSVPDYTQKNTKSIPEFVLQSVPQSVPQAVLQTIIGSMMENPKVTRKELADKLDVSVKTVGRYLKKLEAVVSYEGSGYSGHWEVMVPLESLMNQE